MAKIVFHSMAHRGDVFPYVPMASELARRGHDVTYVVPREFHPSFAAEPFRCVHSGTDFSPRTLDEHGPYIARWGMRFGGAFVMRLYFGTFTIPHLDELFEAVDAEVADADLVVAHPAAALIGAMACERRGVPWVSADLFPMLVPTAVEAPAGLPDLGRRGNRLLWRVARSPRLDRLSSGDAFKAFRRRLGLPVPDDWNVIDARRSPHLNLGLASRHYVEPREDWPDGYRLVGFTHWSGPGGGELPDDVRAFLDAGPPPVVVTLGTSGASARPELFERAAAALSELGLRGLFLTSNEAVADRLRAVAGTAGRAGAGGAGGTPNGTGAAGDPVGIWPFVPLAAVLPRARAVVQSGAHGTNALTLAAGLPSAIVPCLFDQRWHGRRQAELGTGILVRRDRRLRDAIARLVSDPSLADRARVLGERIRTEDGTATACDEIDALLARGAAA
jgi:UDP:flavonoid glycosyltransferase YjiC (YdhE family)